MKIRRLHPGDPAPWFRVQSIANPDFRFDTVAGRYIVLAFLGSARLPRARQAIAEVFRRRDLFDDVKASFFGVTADPSDPVEHRVADHYPGYRYFIDQDLAVARLYGAASLEGDAPQVMLRWIVLDPQLRVISVIPFRDGGEDIEQLFALLESLPDVDLYPQPGLHAPILMLRDVFEPDFCRTLIDRYEADGGQESGFMREVDGKTVLVTDPQHKRRRDCVLTEDSLIAETQNRVRRRIVPEIARAYQFDVTRMERYVVACYAAEDRAHFGAHRDNTTAGTAHRRFAVSINLNDDFDGGEVSFPEFGSRSFRPPAGGAVIFSCSLLHQVSEVTHGKRYAFLPFLYNEHAAVIREANNAKLGEGVGVYRRNSG